MKRILYLLCMVLMLALGQSCEKSEEPVIQTHDWDDYPDWGLWEEIKKFPPMEGPVTPPEDLVRQKWTMQYYPNIDQHDKVTRDVVIVWDNNEIYIQGFFVEFPEAWIKGIRRNNDIYFQDSHHFADKNGQPVFFRCGYFYWHYEGGWSIDFDRRLTLVISEDGNTITREVIWGQTVRGAGFYETSYCAMFWHDIGEKDEFIKNDGLYSSTDYVVVPKLTYDCEIDEGYEVSE